MAKKKTKKEKIISSLRRQLEAQKRSDFVSPSTEKNIVSSVMPKTIDEKHEIIKPVLREPISAKEKQLDLLSDQSIKFIKKDLLKSLFFSLIAIAFEFVLYWKIS